jgi:hypothetical protein
VNQVRVVHAPVGTVDVSRHRVVEDVEKARGVTPVMVTGVSTYGDAQETTSGARGEHPDNAISQPSD